MRSARAHLPKPRKIIRGVVTAMFVTLLEDGVVVGVRRRAAAEEAQLAVAVVLERVPRAGWDEGGVARAKAAPLTVDLEVAGALQDEVDLLGRAVVVARRGLARLERRLGEALELRVMQLANRRAVLRREGLRPVHRLDAHDPIIAAARTGRRGHLPVSDTGWGSRGKSRAFAARPCLRRARPGVRHRWGVAQKP